MTIAKTQDGEPSERVAIERLLKGMFDAASAIAQPTVRIPKFLPKAPGGRVIVIGAGKGSAAMALVGGVHPVLCREVVDAGEVSELACRTVSAEGFGGTGQTVVISAGMPFGAPGTTNLLRLAQIA